MTRASLSHISRHLRSISLLTVLSRVLGLIRDAAMAARFGNGPLLDAFTVAFRIPNLARALLGEGAMATAFLPAYVATRNIHGGNAANRLVVAVLICLSGVLLAVVAVAELLLLASGTILDLSPDGDLLRQLLMVLTPYVGFLCLTSQLSAVLNAENRFGLPALLPAVLNVIWLLGLCFVVPLWVNSTEQLRAMAWCVVIAGGAQLILAVVGVRGLGFHYVPDWRQAWDGVRTMAGHMLPVLGGLLVVQLQSLLDSVMAWCLTPTENGSSPLSALGFEQSPIASGTASALYFGQRLYQFPLGVFGVALGTVLFPLLAEHAQRGDRERLRADFSLGLRLVAAIGIPASAGLVVLAGPLAALCFQYGAFDASDAAQTARMIAAYGSGVWAYCGLLIIHRGFYALNDRLTPVRAGMAALGLNLILNLTFIWIWGGAGFAVATAVSSMIQCLTVGWLFRRAIGGWHGGEFAIAVLKSVLATMAMSGAALLALRWLDQSPGWSSRGPRVLIPLLSAILAYYTAAWLLRFREPWEVLRISRAGR